ncbi:MAG: DUF3276 family protein [Bacteroidetes bacterium]|nr:DUF3276 family protein [Bacteroidota bacterium]
MEHENHDGNDLFSKRLRAGRRRTYFFDVRTTRSNDYYLTITESKKRFDQDGYDRHKIFLYKEDFNKFVDALQETVNHIKTELLPEYDFDEFSSRDDDYKPASKTDAEAPVEMPAFDETITASTTSDSADEGKTEDSTEDPTKGSTEDSTEPAKAEETKDVPVTESTDTPADSEGDLETKSEDVAQEATTGDQAGEKSEDDVNEDELKWD